MGMYTELELTVVFEKTLPADILSILNYMVTIDADAPEVLPDHSFFQIFNWYRTLKSASSAYFDYSTVPTLTLEDHGGYVLHARGNIKNYEQQFETFLDWLYQNIKYIDASTSFVGYIRHENHNLPTIISLTKDGVKYLELYEPEKY
jgi:hypothetical protein